MIKYERERLSDSAEAVFKEIYRTIQIGAFSRTQNLICPVFSSVTINIQGDNVQAIIETKEKREEGLLDRLRDKCAVAAEFVKYGATCSVTYVNKNAGYLNREPKYMKILVNVPVISVKKYYQALDDKKKLIEQEKRDAMSSRISSLNNLVQKFLNSGFMLDIINLTTLKSYINRENSYILDGLTRATFIVIDIFSNQLRWDYTTNTNDGTEYKGASFFELGYRNMKNEDEMLAFTEALYLAIINNFTIAPSTWKDKDIIIISAQNQSGLPHYFDPMLDTTYVRLRIGIAKVDVQEVDTPSPIKDFF